MIKLFKALIGPSLIAESTGIEPDPDINRTHCLAGNRYHHQALLSKNEGVGLSIQDSLTSRIPHQPLAGRLAKTQLSAKILHSIFCFSRTLGI